MSHWKKDVVKPNLLESDKKDLFKSRRLFSVQQIWNKKNVSTTYDYVVVSKQHQATSQPPFQTPISCPTAAKGTRNRLQIAFM